MTPLASEILYDLEHERSFAEDGATCTDLQQWLGEPRGEIRGALAVLLLGGHIHREGFRYFAGPSTEGMRGPQILTSSYINRPRILSMTKDGYTPTEIASELRITRSLVSGVLYRARKSA